MFADVTGGEDMFIRGKELIIDDDSLFDLEAALAGQVAVGPNAGGENHQVRWNFSAIFEQHAAHGFVTGEFLNLNTTFDRHLLLFEVGEK